MDLLKRPSTDFNAVRDGRQSLPLYVDIDLTTARSISAGTALVLNIAGNSFFANPDPAGGSCVVHFQDTNLGASSAPFFVSPGFIANVGFTQLLIENTAQPAAKIRIFYGVDMDFQPGSSATLAISGSVRVAGELGNNAFNLAGAGGFASSTPVSAGSNPNGLLVTSFSMHYQDTMTNYLAAAATQAMPALLAGTWELSKIDSVISNGTNVVLNMSLPMPIFVNAGTALNLRGMPGASGVAYSYTGSYRLL